MSSDRAMTPNDPGTTEPELSCKELVELVTDYLEGTLASSERVRFDEHLAGCPFCQIYLAQMRETIDMVGHLPEDAIPPQALDALLTHFRRKP
ncbi:MAG TPA: zf-HC2 domain-containing protein [Gemmatimonadaceae bacterium]|jgi:predicted anti-sigma-YlaC factor YlaD